jgi:hypothetical protein
MIFDYIIKIDIPTEKNALKINTIVIIKIE